jgi:hypothetical protein
MSLVRLLTTTGSVDREVNDSHRYKMANPLPKFAPTKRPISLAPIRNKKAEDKVMQNELLVAEKGLASELGAAGTSEPFIGVLSVGVFEKEQVGVEESAPSQVAAMKSENWFSKLLNLFRRKRTSAPVPAPVQTEWSLDKVKVVRNDLSDVDLDIVFASTDLSSRSAKVSAKKEQLVSSAWRRVNPNPKKQDEMILK